MLQDSLRSLRQYYYNAPQFAKNIIGGSYRVLPDTMVLGKSYRDFVALIRESESWNEQTMDDYQFEQLKQTLALAYECIPFYRKKYDKHGVNPAQFRYLDDIKKFPVLTKLEVKENLHQLTNTQIPKWKWLTGTTGGSTAEPMRFYQLKGVTRSKEKAFIANGWARIGYRHGMRAVQLKGRPVGNPCNKVFWEFEPIQNILEMDSNYLTPENIPLYCDAIRRFKPNFIIGFPSSVYFFAKYLKQSALPVPQVKGVMLASENVYSWQREFIESVFSCRVYSHYGHSEMTLLGMESENSHNLLFYPQYGYLELLDPNGITKSSVGDKGELVGTTFHNPIMPFIRYKTQDIGIWGERDAKLPYYPAMKEVEGRLQEFIVTSDMRAISICTMGAAHFDNLDNVVETQYFQEVPGSVQFHVVPSKAFSEKDQQNIQKALARKMGPGLSVEVIPVSEIKRTRSGKHMMLVQKIKHGEFNLEEVK